MVFLKGKEYLWKGDSSRQSNRKLKYTITSADVGYFRKLKENIFSKHLYPKNFFKPQYLMYVSVNFIPY